VGTPLCCQVNSCISSWGAMAPQCFFDRRIIMRHFIRALVLNFIGLTLTLSTGAMEFALAYEPMAVVSGGAVKEMVHFSNLKKPTGLEHIFIMFHRPALTNEGTQDLVRFTGDRRGIIMQCGMHTYMQGHGLAVDNPYYALTGSEGMFDIRDLPASTYRIKAWHTTLGHELTVVAGESSSVEFTFKAK
jgi:hypothetical protein